MRNEWDHKCNRILNETKSKAHFTIGIFWSTYDEANEIVKQNSGFDLVIVSGDVENMGNKYQKFNNTLTVYSDKYGKQLHRIDMSIKKGVKNIKYDRILLNKDVKDGMELELRFI